VIPVGAVEQVQRGVIRFQLSQKFAADRGYDPQSISRILGRVDQQLKKGLNVWFLEATREQLLELIHEQGQFLTLAEMLGEEVAERESCRRQSRPNSQLERLFQSPSKCIGRCVAIAWLNAKPDPLCASRQSSFFDDGLPYACSNDG